MPSKTASRAIHAGVCALLFTGLTSCAPTRGPRAGASDQWLARKGFAERGEWSSTALHLRAQQMRSTVRISQLIRTVPGVRLQPSRDNPLGLIRVWDENREPCVLQVFLNGVRMVPRDPGDRVDLDARVGVPGLDALELHLGPDGPVYDPEGCGSLLLWDHGMQHVGGPEFLGSIRGQVESESPDEVVGVRIGSDGPVQRPDAAGFFRFSGLRPGEYDLEFIISGQPVTHQSARVYAYMESKIELQGRRR